MRVRRLGDGGPLISVLGFGAWAAGGPWQFGWGPQDDADSIAAIRTAVDLGVSWVDTAAAYGWGHSEEVVGRALADRGDVLVFTKCGILAEDGGSRRTLDPASIRAECEASLRRIGRDHVDMFQFHWPHPDDGVAIEDSWAVMLELVDAGKVRWPGVSNFDVSLLQRCEQLGHVQSLQPPYSLVRRDAEAEVLPWCRMNGAGAIVYSPMQNGLLSGEFDRARLAGLAADDWRRGSPYFQEPLLDRCLDVVEQIRPVADEIEMSVGALAIAWTLANPAVTGAIVGARRPEQVRGWIDAGITDIGAAADDLRNIAASAGT